MPQLWTSLHISDVFVVRMQDREAPVINWLERFTPLPIILSVACSPPNNSMIDSLLRFSTRWCGLHITNLNMLQFLKFGVVDAPLLADINLKFGNYEGVNPEVLCSLLVRRVSSGRVSITSWTLSTLVPCTPFTWNHLTFPTLLRRFRAGWGDSAPVQMYKCVPFADGLYTACILQPSSLA
jgi:hypothetical protein